MSIIILKKQRSVNEKNGVKLHLSVIFKSMSWLPALIDSAQNETRLTEQLYSVRCHESFKAHNISSISQLFINGYWEV